jgi:hypothetical protein
MRTEANLKQPEIVELLKSYGFKSPHLKDHKEKTYTYAVADFDLKKLEKMFGAPTLAANGKVAVYKVPGVGRLGLSTANSLVRFIDESVGSNRHVDTSHLSYVKVPAAYSKAYLQAQGKESLRIKYCQKLFDYLNAEKFDNRLPMPRISVSPANPKGTSKATRGAYTGGPNFGAGSIWMESFMFNAREAFFLEVFLHEMCHMAAWTLSRSTDRSEQGHGPIWKDWMTKVGLDARRFDPTDDTEYQTGPAKHAEEEKLTRMYGPAATEEEVSKLKKLPSYPGALSDAYLLYKGRLYFGTAAGPVFRGEHTKTKKLIEVKYKNSRDLGPHLWIPK